MQQQESGGAKTTYQTAYQRWKASGQPRPFIGESIAVERFDFFAMASLLLAIAVLGWWIHSIYTVAFPSKTNKIHISYTKGGASIFSTPTSTPFPTPTPSPIPWGGPGAGGTLPGGTRPGGTQGMAWALMGIGASLLISSFLFGHFISKYRIVKNQ
jgi:hypothetical protein